MKAHVALTVAESKRLIADGVVAHAEARKPLRGEMMECEHSVAGYIGAMS